MPQFLTPLHESNDCHTPAGSPAGGQFCSAGASTGYRMVFRSEMEKATNYRASWPPFLHAGVVAQMTEDDHRKFRSARVALVFGPNATAHLGAPVKWTAPNGVTVLYARGQRRSEARGSGTYHDFDVQGEVAVPLTRNVGPGRRALRAWAKAHITDVITARWQARRMVRPGD